MVYNVHVLCTMYYVHCTLYIVHYISIHRINFILMNKYIHYYSYSECDIYVYVIMSEVILCNT